MAGWHHWFDGHESEWTLGVGDGQGGLACCDSWGRKESDMTERLNWTTVLYSRFLSFLVFFHAIIWEKLSDVGYIWCQIHHNYREAIESSSFDVNGCILSEQILTQYVYKASTIQGNIMQPEKIQNREAKRIRNTYVVCVYFWNRR